MNPKRSAQRATYASAVLAGGGWLVWSSPALMAHYFVLGPIFGLAVVYLLAGLAKATPEPDPMGKFWPTVILGVASFLALKGWPIWRGASALTQAFCIAVLTGAGVRFLVVMRPMPSGKLPDLTKLGWPNRGRAASPKAAHAAVSRNRGGWKPPKFSD